MFFQCRYFDGYGEDRIDKGSHIVEAPSRERAAGYVRSEHDRTGMDILMQHIGTREDGIAPPGYTYEKRQIWVTEGTDPGWVRKWNKDRPISSNASVMCAPYGPYGEGPCDHAPVINNTDGMCRRCGQPINWDQDLERYVTPEEGHGHTTNKT